MQFATFSEYTLKVTLLTGSYIFQCLNQQVFCTLFLFRARRSRFWSIIRDSDWQSILSSRANSAVVEWVPDWSFWLRTVSSTSLMFSSIRTDLGHPERSFRAYQSLSYSFFTPFTFHLYSGWLLTILVAPYLYFIQR